MTYKYKITVKHHIKNAWSIIIFAIIALLFPVFMVYRFGPTDLPTFNSYAIVGFLLFFAPQFIIHLKYYFLNRGRNLYCDVGNQDIIIKVDEVSHHFTFDEIKYIDRYKSFPLAEDRSQWFPWDSYNYSVIHLTNGQCFVVTSLLVPNMDLPLDESKVKLRKRFYCNPFGVKEVLDA